MNKCLILCAGRQRRDGWTTVDANPRVKPDIVAILPPVPGENWEKIELIHGIEHFYLWEAEVLLQDCLRALAPGGLLILEQPNIRFAAEVFCGLRSKPRGHKDQFDMWPFYGDPRHRDSLFCHKWGYTPESLTEMLVQCGFDLEGIGVKKARSHFPIRDFRIEAVKPQ